MLEGGSPRHPTLPSNTMVIKMKANIMAVVNVVRSYVINTPHTHFWLAELHDGDVIVQYEYVDGEQIYHTFREAIEEEKKGNLKTVYWIPFNPAGRMLACTPGKDRRIILFQRGYINPIKGMARPFIYALGWQATINGRNVKSIDFLMPDGSVHNHFNHDFPDINEKVK